MRAAIGSDFAQGDHHRGGAARHPASRPGRNGSRSCWRKATALRSSTRSIGFYVAQEHPEILARIPSQRAPWDGPPHVRDRPRAGKPGVIPITRWRRRSRVDFGRACLTSSRADRRDARARACGDANPRPALPPTVDSEAFRAALGRIACGYDGGQILD